MQICDITRRALQEYDALGLVKHTAETAGGYWLYDDTAIATIIFIRTFIEAGFSREEVKFFMQSNPEDMQKICDEALERLSLRKRKLEGLIAYIEDLRYAGNFSPLIINNLMKGGVSALLNYVSISDILEKYSNNIKEIPDYMRKYILQCAIDAFNIGVLHQKDVDDDKVKAALQVLIKDIINMVEQIPTDNELYGLTELDADERSKLFDEDEIKNIYSEEEFNEMRTWFEAYSGEGSWDYFVSVIWINREVILDAVLKKMEERKSSN